MVHPKDRLRPQINCQSFYYSPKISRVTTCIKIVALPLHALSVSLTQSQRLFTMLQYNTIPYIVVLQCFSFIGEIPWENTMGHPIPWVHKNVGQHTSQKFSSRDSPSKPYRGPTGSLYPSVRGDGLSRTPRLVQVYGMADQ